MTRKTIIKWSKNKDKLRKELRSAEGRADSLARKVNRLRDKLDVSRRVRMIVRGVPIAVHGSLESQSFSEVTTGMGKRWGRVYLNRHNMTTWGGELEDSAGRHWLGKDWKYHHTLKKLVLNWIVTGKNPTDAEMDKLKESEL